MAAGTSHFLPLLVILGKHEFKQSSDVLDLYKNEFDKIKYYSMNVLRTLFSESTIRIKVNGLSDLQNYRYRQL